MGRSLEEMFSLKGKLALVTGASGGIGGEIAAALAGAGAAVALSGRSEERLERRRASIAADGGTAEIFAGEIDSMDDVRALAAAIDQRMGPVDILVNCAGINRRQPVAEVVPETFDQIMNVNLRMPYFLSQALLKGMIARGGGKVVNIGSLTTGVGIGNLSVYGMSKSAIGQMTRVMAVEWAVHGIQVNCLCPGFIKTELTAPLWADPEKSGWILGRTPAGRPGVPADLAGMAVYLSSPASNFTTGQVLYVDGGFTAGGQW